MTYKTSHNLDPARLVAHGTVATRSWLLAQGASKHALDNALKSRKLKKLAVGVYARPEVAVTWQGVVSALQDMTDHAVQVGGVSALQLLGLAHYLGGSTLKQVHLYADRAQPSWLGRLPLETQFVWHRTGKLWRAEILNSDQFALTDEWREGMPSLRLSCPEKACFEMLAGVPETTGFDHADELFQGMTSLSPSRLEALLRGCCSVKVKRLFFWFAERQDYAWLRSLDSGDFDLGKGKRVIARGGRLNKKYQITVPASLYE